MESSHKLVVLVTEPIPQTGLDILQQLPNIELRVLPRGSITSSEELRSHLGDVDALLSMLSVKVDKSCISSAPKLKIIANYAVGFNNIDLDAAKARGILVTNTPDVLTDATADLAMGLILSVSRQFIKAERDLRTGNFVGWEPLGYLGPSLQGKTLGIVGLGRIGDAVAQRALAFGMNVIYTKRSGPSETAQKLGMQHCIDEAKLFQESDVLSFHCPLTPETKYLLNSETIELLKPEAIVINTARGPVIDEAALAEALHSGRIAGAGLDVFELEPIIHPRLLTAPNTVLLPHIGSATKETRSAMAQLAASSIAHILTGGEAGLLKNRVI